MGIFSSQKESAGVPVQTIDGAEGEGVSLPLEMRDHRRGQSRLRVPGRGMNGEIRRLVHCQHTFILVHHRQRQVRPLHPDGIRRKPQTDRLPRPQAVNRTDMLTIRRDSLLHPLEPGKQTGGNPAAFSQEGLHGGSAGSFRHRIHKLSYAVFRHILPLKNAGEIFPGVCFCSCESRIRCAPSSRSCRADGRSECRSMCRTASAPLRRSFHC